VQGPAPVMCTVVPVTVQIAARGDAEPVSPEMKFRWTLKSARPSRARQRAKVNVWSIFATVRPALPLLLITDLSPAKPPRPPRGKLPA